MDINRLPPLERQKVMWERAMQLVSSGIDLQVKSHNIGALYNECEAKAHVIFALVARRHHCS